MIPSYTISGVLPPFIGDNPVNEAAMSPYHTTLLEVCERFALSKDRVKILTGLIKYRQAIKQAGFSRGFQWIDGSFVENVEAIRSRPPADIDIVTFTYPPEFDRSDSKAVDNFLQKNSHLLSSEQCKIDFACDAYLVDLSSTPEIIVSDARYWFGLFSHQRETSLWKGILQIDLDTHEDEALKILESRKW